MTGSNNYGAIQLAIAMAEGQAPEWIHLLPAGRFEGTPAEGAGPWQLNDPEAVIRASMAAGRPLTIDYDHQTDWAAKPSIGGTARAAGWITEIQRRDDGLWGKVEWTKAGAVAVAEREYRYLSPVFTYASEDGSVQQILRAALTNNPALTLTALATQGDGNSMDELLKTLRQALGLADDAKAETVVASIETLKTDAEAARTQVVAIAEAAGLAKDTKPETIATAIAALKTGGDDPDPAKFVPIADYQALATRVGDLETSLSGDKVAAAVDGAVKAGKILPAQREWATAYAAKDLAGFNDFVAKQPQIVRAGGQLPSTPEGQGGDGLTADEQAICSQLGITVEAFKKQREADIKKKEAAA